MGNMNIFQFIVPLTFLAIWALTSLLNRDAQPLPPRTVRPPGPPGLKPGGAMPPLRPVERRVEPGPRDQAARWSTPQNAGRPVAGRRPDDDILIIDAEPRRAPSGGSRPDGSPTPRRGSRPRSTQPAPPKRQDAPTPRALTAAMGQDQASQLNRHMELNPLSKLQVPLSAPVGQEVAATPHTPPISASLAALSSAEIQMQMRTPAKLREAIILNELLRPPLALRGRRGGI